jgi:hypothetical protein
MHYRLYRFRDDPLDIGPLVDSETLIGIRTERYSAGIATPGMFNGKKLSRERSLVVAPSYLRLFDWSLRQ